MPHIGPVNQIKLNAHLEAKQSKVEVKMKGSAVLERR